MGNGGEWGMRVFPGRLLHIDVGTGGAQGGTGCTYSTPLLRNSLVL